MPKSQKPKTVFTTVRRLSSTFRNVQVLPKSQVTIHLTAKDSVDCSRCKHCGSLPHIRPAGGLGFDITCSNPKCQELIICFKGNLADALSEWNLNQLCPRPRT